MLSQHDVDVVKSTIPVLAQAGTVITDHFYNRMFSHNPELQHTFNMTNQKTGRQKTALYDAIVAYAHHLDNLDVLTQAVTRIANKHASLNIQPDDYQIVGHHLIETFRELLGENFTPEIETAWTNAYLQLANIFIDTEETLYSVTEQTRGGWRGKREFIVAEKRVESELVTSFVFTPKDTGAVVGYRPGQYIAVDVQPEGEDYREIRQYSLSDTANGESYRISVKRESLPFAGVVSNHLHDHLHPGDTIELYAPRGDFYLQQNNQPVVLISAGVGITPMMAMLETLHAGNCANEVHFLHACEGREQHSFCNRTSEICEQHQWTQSIWYQDEQEAKALNTHHGLMQLQNITLPAENGHFYICGPVGFMSFIHSQLSALGVSEERIHYEVFGPHANLNNEAE